MTLEVRRCHAWILSKDALRKATGMAGWRAVKAGKRVKENPAGVQVNSDQ